MPSVACLTIANGHHNSACRLELNADAGIEQVYLRCARLQIVYGQRLVLQVCCHAYDIQHTQLMYVMTPL